MNQMTNKSLQKRIYTFLVITLLAITGILLFLKSRPLTDSTGYTPDLSHEYLVTQHTDATGVQAMFYTIENDDTFIIIDGGWAENEAAVRKIIAEHNNEVDAWIITHPHKDHAGAFNAIQKDLNGITIHQIYDNGFDYDFIIEAGEPYDDLAILQDYYALTKDLNNVTHLRRGDILTICGLTFSIYNAYDDIVLEHVGEELDYQNNASLLFKVSSKHSSILFTSDIKYDMNSYLLEQYSKDIVCDYVQAGHHGNWSFSEEFYDATGASLFFFDAPTTITESPDFPASELKASLEAKNKTVLDYSTAPHTVTLK